jgi:hypothetical protein
MTTRQRSALHKAIRKEVESNPLNRDLSDFCSEELDRAIEVAIDMTLSKAEKVAA